MKRLYLLHPQEKFLPGVNESLSQVITLVAADPAWATYPISRKSYDQQNGFSFLDIYSEVVAGMGPVVLLEPVQTRAREGLRALLRNRSIVVVSEASCPEQIWEAMETAKARFIQGDPFLPRKFVVAVLILRKLVNWNYWGGDAKNKAYLYADELAKGRGVDNSFADIASEVANDLLQKGLLKKKPSGGKAKYALNPERRLEIMAAANDLDFQNTQLRDLLMRDNREVSARELD